MILDSFKIRQLIVQVRYAHAIELWDHAGSVNRRVQKIWPGVEVVGEAVQPNNIVLKNDKVQVDTGLEQSTISLGKLTTLDQHTSQQIVDTFVAWRHELNLTKLTRVSSRVLYVKELPTLGEANQELFKLNLCRMPPTKVFDQPTDSPLNTFVLVYRLEDEASFAFLRLHTEGVKLELKADSEFTTLKDTSEVKNRLIVDFDRGLKQPTDAASFRMDDWLKGFMHVLRRDVEKVLKA
ncbi:MAG: hypothetical protein ACKVQA_00360 [Burkholderiales bacterium]